MSCNCKNKEYHPCQNGGECKCGGKCKKNDFNNASGQYDEHLNATGQYEEHNNIAGTLADFKNESSNTNKLVYKLVGLGLVLGLTYIIYTKIK